MNMENGFYSVEGAIYQFRYLKSSDQAQFNIPKAQREA